MRLSNNLFRIVLLTFALVTSAAAIPFPGSLKHTVLQVRQISPNAVIESFHPESSFEVRVGLLVLPSDIEY